MLKRCSLIGILFAVLTMALPALSFETPDLRQAAHREIEEFLDKIPGHLHDLSTSLWHRYMDKRTLSERPLITLMLHYRDEIRLSPAQTSVLERLRSEHERERIRLEADLRIAELDLKEILDKDTVDLQKVEALIRKTERIQGDFRLARIQAIEKAKAELTPEQLAKLKSLLQETRRSTDLSARRVD